MTAPFRAEQPWIKLSDPDMSRAELDEVAGILQSARISAGSVVALFESEFAAYAGRKYAVAVASGTIGLLLALKAYGIGPGDEVVASSYSWRETAHAIVLAGAIPVFADIDYYSGTLNPEKAAAKITAATRAILAGNANGHPANWPALRAVAADHDLILLEDSTEAIGTIGYGRRVGGFGDCAIFDFSQPLPMTCGEAGMVVTDDAAMAVLLRKLRGREPGDRGSVVIGMTPPFQAQISDLTAALGLAQLRRIDNILLRRKQAEYYYFEYVKSFEGIKDPYVAPEVEEIHWFLYLVHLGTRFTRSSRDAIIDDVRTERIDAHAYSQPLHMQPYYQELGYRRGNLLVTEKVADRILALPFHAHLSESEIAFIVGTMKDASINIGAGTAIYL